jgi:hypothetical protein
MSIQLGAVPISRHWRGFRIDKIISAYAWRPFADPLSPASERQAFVILSTLFAWLVDAHARRSLV